MFEQYLIDLPSVSVPEESDYRLAMVIVGSGGSMVGIAFAYRRIYPPMTAPQAPRTDDSDT
ncbi:MAG: uncharacterized protein KVP18_004653 [Porospora cf. gigantea A]|nr:MAG: hypothetical protein KVP18_004653 [Porospora cf. gigantea A]